MTNDQTKVPPMAVEDAQNYVASLLDRVLACNPINPYRGWNLMELKEVFNTIDRFLMSYSGPVVQHQQYLNKFLSARIGSHEGFMPGLLTKVADELRAELGRPTSLDLNPDIEAMTTSLRRTGGTGPLQRFLRNCGVVSKKDTLPKIEDYLSSDGSQELRELYALAILRALTPMERQAVLKQLNHSEGDDDAQPHP